MHNKFLHNIVTCFSFFLLFVWQEGIESSKRVYQKHTNQHAPEENEPSDAPLPLKFAHFTSQYIILIAEVCYTE